MQCGYRSVTRPSPSFHIDQRSGHSKKLSAIQETSFFQRRPAIRYNCPNFGFSLMTQPATTENGGFVRGLNLFDATMLVVGTMIGSGIFIVSADMARLINSPGWL